MNARTTTAPRLVSIRTLGWLAVALMLAMALLPSVGIRSVFAADPVAVYTSDVNTDLAGNPSCNSVEALGYSNGQDWGEHKIEGNDLGNGVNTFGTHTITITNFDNSLPTRGFSWSSNFGVDAVIIKTGNGGGGYNTLAVYAPFANSPEATSGSLTTESPTGISHISFCWEHANPTTPPTDEPTTPPTATPEASVGGETATPEASVGGETATPRITLPPTDTIGGGAGPDSNAWQLMLVVMAGLLASVLVLTPSRTARRR